MISTHIDYSPSNNKHQMTDTYVVNEPGLNISNDP